MPQMQGVAFDFELPERAAPPPFQANKPPAFSVGDSVRPPS